MKLKRIIRYHHLTRNSVDEETYPPNQQYILYTHRIRSKEGRKTSLKPGSVGIFSLPAKSILLSLFLP